MQIANFNPIVVDGTAGGTFILTVAEANDLTTKGMTSFAINPSVDIVLVDNQGVSASIPGTVANSPLVCPANTVTVVAHRSGAIKAISTGANSTVRRAGGCAP
jgi:hypothetical protein